MGTYEEQMVSGRVHVHMGMVDFTFLYPGVVRMTKFGEIELVLGAKEMELLQEIRDLLKLDVEQSGRILGLIGTVAQPQEEEQNE